MSSGICRYPRSSEPQFPASHVQDYSKLPKDPNVDQVFLLDPLIATGGTACAALAMLLDWGIPGMFCLWQRRHRTDDMGSLLEHKIKLLCVLASKDGLANVQKEYPGLEVRNTIRSSDAILNSVL